jgi:uncharacterized protein YndB with AHSA1/START domain
MSSKDFDLAAWLGTTERVFQWHDQRIRAVVVRRRFDAPPERVWRAWVEGWTARIAEGEAKPGNTVVLDLGQPQRTSCDILACEAPKRLLATWTYGAPGAGRPDEVEVTIAAHGGGSLLELEHRSENGGSWAPGIGAGWEAGLMMFTVQLAGDDPAIVPAREAFPKLDALWIELAERATAQRAT